MALTRDFSIMNEKINRILSFVFSLYTILLVPFISWAVPTTDLTVKKLKAEFIKTHSAPKIDGHIDEKAWVSIPWSEGFTERSPKPGAKPKYQGGVKALFDGQNLYVAVRLDLAKDEVPSAIELRRDQTRIWSDDTVTLKLDTRLDQRTTLGLVLNCGGAQLDFLALDNGKGFYIEYDTIWEGAVSVIKEAWFAEYRIPLSTLGLSKSAVEKGQIGFNVTRDHNARQATDDWQHLPPEFGPFSALHYGRLDGFSEAKTGRPLILIPYFLSRLSTDYSGAILNFEDSKIAGGTPSIQMGGEFRWNFSSSDWLEATMLTDFAQVDLDDPLINLNRFPLFLPERRPYFINGLDIFAFGSRGRSQPFFSRRIGLTQQGQEVPVLGGLKLYGRRGKWRYGVLSALTGEEQNSNTGQESFIVTRTRYDLGEGGYLGLIGMLKDEASNNEFFAEDHLHFAGGVDGRIRLIDTRLEWSGFYTTTATPEWEELSMNTEENNDSSQEIAKRFRGRASGHSAGMNLAWRGQNFRPTMDYLWVDEAFDPVMGFVYRKDVHSLSIGAPYLFFKPTSFLRTAQVAIAASHDRSSDWSLDLGQSLMSTMSLCHTLNICLDVGFALFEDEVRSSFPLAGIAEIQEGRYLSKSGVVSVRTPGGRQFEVSGSYTYQPGYFAGYLHQVYMNGSFAFNRHLRFLTLLNWAWFEVEGRDLNSSVEDSMDITSLTGDSQGISGQIIVTPNPKLLFDTVAQVNSDQKRLLVQSRVRYRYLPGSDLFVVFRWQEADTFNINEQQENLPADWRLTLKLNVRFDFLQ